jgi:phage-related protein
MMSEKRLVWLGSSLDDVRAFPARARRLAGYELRRVQQGLMPSDWKPMQTVGPGVNEIRIHTSAEHRVLYVARFLEAVYVLHAFGKRTQRTPHTDIALAQRRLADLATMRTRHKES